MAADGGHGPKPYTQRQARTVFVRVPAVDWPAVKRGLKTEFRGSPRMASGLRWVEPPTPVVTYAVRRPTYESRLMVLENVWEEPLGSISAESLEHEGFPDLPHFRRYWMQRERKRFEPLRMVTVYEVRPWATDDHEVFGDKLLQRLFGDWL